MLEIIIIWLMPYIGFIIDTRLYACVSHQYNLRWATIVKLIYGMIFR